ncbi:unnamed protein product [Porites evermanni]|uniref:Uncharacterized protein n=1 Tax=Porites evermanni TaxID=104178 RepID=A0ABN8M5Q5_9CNID|nr:unnamed protein product [Porites evermanni]
MVYRALVLRGLAITQVIFGSSMIVAGITSILGAIDHWSTKAGFGMWVGIWVLISGLLGCIGAKDVTNPNKCMIGCFMGFSITACVIAGIMFICYCVTLQELSLITHCKADDFWWNLDKYCYSRSERKNASFGLKVGSCQLAFSVVVFFVALASSIYCCKAVCCGVPPLGSVTSQQVMYIPRQQIYPGGQAGVVVIQPSGAIASTSHGYVFAAGQQTVFLPPLKEAKEHERPPPYSNSARTENAVPSTASLSGAAGDVHLPYSYSEQTGNALPSTASASGVTEDMSPPYSYRVRTGNTLPSTASASGVTEDMSPPYSYRARTGNTLPSTASASGVAEDAHLPYSYSARTGNVPPSTASAGGVTEDAPAWVMTI